MKPKVRAFISAVAILLIGWLDIEFLGDSSKNAIPELWQQAFHGLALLITMGIGYLNWKNFSEKWLSMLWLGCYGVVVLALLAALGLYFIRGGSPNQFFNFALWLRNIFIWPLPFLTFYVLSVAASTAKEKE